MMVLRLFKDPDRLESLWILGYYLLVIYNPKLGLSSALSIGLLFVSFDAHALFPSVITDMKNKDDFGMVVGIVYVIVGSFYLILGVLGYIMFGYLIM
jgi:amino acid permease